MKIGLSIRDLLEEPLEVVMSESRREELNAPSAAHDATILTLNYAGG
jgi:hypothetical protein